MTGHKNVRLITVNKGVFYGRRFIDEFMDGNKAYFACEKLHLPASRKGSFIYWCYSNANLSNTTE